MKRSLHNGIEISAPAEGAAALPLPNAAATLSQANGHRLPRQNVRLARLSSFLTFAPAGHRREYVWGQ